jgi:hypothetical protein
MQPRRVPEWWALRKDFARSEVLSQCVCVCVREREREREKERERERERERDREREKEQERERERWDTYHELGSNVDLWQVIGCNCWPGHCFRGKITHCSKKKHSNESTASTSGGARCRGLPAVDVCAHACCGPPPASPSAMSIAIFVMPCHKLSKFSALACDYVKALSGTFGNLCRGAAGTQMTPRPMANAGP